MDIWFKSALGSDSRAQQEKSILADWQSYAERSDLEAGPSTAAGAAAAAEQAGTAISGFFNSSINTVSSSLNNVSLSGLTPTTFTMPSQQQWVYFFCSMGAGVFFLVLAFTIFLPVMVLAPAKFALSFTLGCLCIMTAFTVLKGWKEQLQHMLSSDRLPFSTAYVGSVMATLYSAIIMKSYLLSLVCSGLQVVAIVYYVLSYFPGGAAGVKFVLSMFTRAMFGCLTMCYKTVMR